jgi:hypothetical protein
MTSTTSPTRQSWQRVVNPGTVDTGQSRPQRATLFVTIEWSDGRLSITGVEGPRSNGNCSGSAGQCIGALDDVAPAPSWNQTMIGRLRKIWNRWHLNDMRAGTIDQESHLRTLTFPGYPVNHYDWASAELAKAGLNPDGGYRYGSSWLREDVPADVLDWLYRLPASDRPHPWGDRDRLLAIYALTDEQGTAMSETALCAEHYTAENRQRMTVPEGDGVWHDCTGNDELACQICGAGEQS